MVSSLKELIAKQREQVADAPGGRAVVVLAGEEVIFELAKLPAKEWLDLAAVHPPRVGSSSDTTLGFNPHSLAAAYPVGSVRRVDGVGDDESLVPVDEDDYRAMFDGVLTAVDIDTIGTVIWAVNVWNDRMAVAAARKASQGGPSKKQSSPES